MWCQVRLLSLVYLDRDIILRLSLVHGWSGSAPDAVTCLISALIKMSSTSQTSGRIESTLKPLVSLRLVYP